MLSRCLLTKFLHQSSVESLLRIHYWLGSHSWEGQGQLDHLGVLKEAWYSRGEKSWIEKDGVCLCKVPVFSPLRKVLINISYFHYWDLYFYLHFLILFGFFFSIIGKFTCIFFCIISQFFYTSFGHPGMATIITINATTLFAVDDPTEFLNLRAQQIQL